MVNGEVFIVIPAIYIAKMIKNRRRLVITMFNLQFFLALLHIKNRIRPHEITKHAVLLLHDIH